MKMNQWGRMAQVGYTHSEGDVTRSLRVIHWLAKRGLPIRFGDIDNIDLNNGRDFLAERHKYDVVVLHFIMRHRAAQFSAAILGEAPECRVSALSSWVGWRQRLVRTKARLIFVFGGVFEVSGGFLAVLDGYNLTVEKDEAWETFSVFEKPLPPRWGAVVNKDGSTEMVLQSVNGGES